MWINSRKKNNWVDYHPPCTFTSNVYEFLDFKVWFAQLTSLMRWIEILTFETELQSKIQDLKICRFRLNLSWIYQTKCHQDIQVPVLSYLICFWHFFSIIISPRIRPTASTWITRGRWNNGRAGGSKRVESNGNKKNKKNSNNYAYFCSATLLTSKIITEIIENHYQFSGWRVAAIKLFHVDLDKPWNYLRCCHKKAPPLPLLPFERAWGQCPPSPASLEVPELHKTMQEGYSKSEDQGREIETTTHKKGSRDTS